MTLPAIMVTEKETLGDDMMAYAIDLRDLFGLSHWEININIRDHIGDVEGPRRGVVSGECVADAAYFHATINLLPTATQDSLRHEFIHIALARIDLAVQRIIELLPEDLQAHAQNIYSDALEQDVESMSRSLGNAIKPTSITLETVAAAEEGSNE